MTEIHFPCGATFTVGEHKTIHTCERNTWHVGKHKCGRCGVNAKVEVVEAA